MKKILVFALLTTMLLLGQNVSAQDFYITDVKSSSPSMALTSDGYVFEMKNATGNDKTKIKDNVVAMTNEKDVFLMKDGSVDYKGKIITGLNIKEIIQVYYDAYREKNIVYIDKDSAMHIYDCENERDFQIAENISEVMPSESLKNMLYMKNKSGELYFYSFYGTTDYSGDGARFKFIASDVCDYSDNYYLKSNGDLYYFNPKSEESLLIMHNVDIWQGIVEHTIDNRVVYSEGMFKVLNKDVCVAEYPSPHGVNDIVSVGSDICYIGKNGLLYFIDISSYYGYHATGDEREFCLSDSIKFSRLFGSLALDINNNLYQIHVKNITTASGSNYSGRYENLNIYLSGALANAVPDKISYPLITTQNGSCYIIENERFLYTAFNNKDINLQINGKSVKLTSPIQILDDRTMYPLRECFNAMGASVQWDGENRIAIGELPGIKIEFPIGKSEYYINGVRYEMDTKAYVDESIGRTYIPIRYAAEGLGFTVDWIEGDLENIIDIHK